MVAGMRIILSIVYVATLNNIAPHAVMMMVWDKGINDTIIVAMSITVTRAFFFIQMQR